LLRNARPEDAESVAALKLATFRETFVDSFTIPYPPDDLAAFEAATYAPAQVAAELADPEHATWIAETDGRMIGYAHVGPCKLPHPEVSPGAGELYQLYVRGEAQGLGFGGRLLTVALNHLARTRPGPVWLGVWSGNLHAQAVYAAHGFVKVGEYGFPVGKWRDEEYIFRRG
jgi:ribosomal protein S18 acetylase RimI-like enzyme